MKRTVLVAVGGPAIQALITAVELAKREESAVTSKQAQVRFYVQGAGGQRTR